MLKPYIDIEKIPVYVMPGMAASPEIFGFLSLPKRFEIHTLCWKIPEKEENLVSYSKRMLEEVHHDNPVLIGVSFGGIIVQEMAKIISVRKLIIISSVKTKFELPRRMRVSRNLGLYSIAPVNLVKSMKNWSKYALTDKLKHRLELYKKFLSVDDPHYLKWSIKQMLCWDQKEPLPGIVHLHGAADPVFPHKYINDCITIPGGTHIMIILKYKWFNENLPGIIEN